MSLDPLLTLVGFSIDRENVQYGMINDVLNCLSAFLGTLSVSMALFWSPLTIGICLRKSTRLTAVIGGLVTALGCLFSSFASQYHQLFLSFGLLLGKKKRKREKEWVLIVPSNANETLLGSHMVDQSFCL